MRFGLVQREKMNEVISKNFMARKHENVMRVDQ